MSVQIMEYGDLVVDGEPTRHKNTLIFPAALDPDAVKIIRRLKKFGHTAYMVGGCVRDLLLGSIPKDFDVSTSARPRQIRRVFKNSTVIGRRFKLAHVHFGDKIIEVSTFRKVPELESPLFKSDGLLIVRDNVYGDERDDAVRRDFTINALFYDIDEEEVIDYTGGVHDITHRVIRTIGDPHIRFQEDPLRILRAIRFSCRLNLEIEPEVFEAMRTYGSELKRCAAQRVTEEIIRIMSCGAAKRALEVMMELGPFEILLPEIHQVLDEEAAFFGWTQSGKELLLNLAEAMDRADRGKRRFENSMFLALLFSHLCGKAVTDALSREDGPRDPGVILSATLRPIALRMGISRRDLSLLKQILIAFPRMQAPKKRRRFKIGEFTRRDYFSDALEFYRQVLEAKGDSLDRYDWWLERRKSIVGEVGEETRPKDGRRRRRPARRRRPPARRKDRIPPQ